MRVLIAALAALTFAAALSAQTGQGAWSSKAGLGRPRTETGAAYVNGRIYVMAGGLGTMESSTLVQEFDVKTDKWRERAPLPMALSHAGVAALNGKVYVVGGFLKNVHLYAEPDAFEDDPPRNTVRTVAWSM